MATATAALFLCAAAAALTPMAAFAEGTAKAVAGKATSAIDAAINHAERSAADKADDERRKTAKALAFTKIKPGDTVFEIEAGSGWYTELFSRLVGSEGAVMMQNPEGFRSFVKDEIDARLADGRLANVTEKISLFDAFDVAPGSVDVATWVQGPHELYFKPPELDSLGDPEASYKAIFEMLKPGGRFVVIDHAAKPGAPVATGHDLHRIDKAVVIGLAKAAGFKLEKESDFLANAADPLDISAFDPAIRGKTDQFALRFRKP